jgi:hypothetical protein
LCGDNGYSVLWPVVVHRIRSIVLNPGVWGFVELEMPEVASNGFEVTLKGFPQDMDDMFGSGVDADGLVKIVVVIRGIEHALHDALEVPKIDEEPLISPGVIQEDGSGNSDFEDIGVTMVSTTLSFVPF